MDTPSSPPGPRRASTAPMATPLAGTGIDSKAGVETLFSHPDVKIISFEARASRVLDATPATKTNPDIDAGSLPWKSPLERIIAVGTFRVYRAPGSVAFLSGGSALQPILPKSQCWCVDEDNSRFVLQIRRPHFWRIELPVATYEEQVMARSFRDILSSVLQFEKTQCPFRRSFTVALPEAPDEPVRKRPWVGRLPLNPVETAQSSRRILAPSAGASTWSGSRGLQGVSITLSHPRTPGHFMSAHARHGTPPPMSEERKATDWRSSNQALEAKDISRVCKGRRLTVPADVLDRFQLPLEPTDADGPEDIPESSPAASQAGSYDTFYSIESSMSLSTSGSSYLAGPYTQLPGVLSCSGDGDHTIRSDRRASEDYARFSSPNAEFIACDEFFDVDSLHEDEGGSSGFAVSRPSARRRNAKDRSEPTSAAKDEEPDGQPCSNGRPDAGGLAKRLPLSLISKTYELLLGPPTHLLTLMLRVAAKICAGEWRGRVDGYGEAGEHIPVQWDYSNGELSDWTDDE
ncbi:hypothetical protein ACCO45_008731 [Purpureocillium lilacinum]|uniref:Uncharacterized protein n=1 Tax=Purpureocillium lilacinum TaxID=33203 RepID=A0ACC4DHR2_PURLI